MNWRGPYFHRFTIGNLHFEAPKATGRPVALDTLLLFEVEQLAYAEIAQRQGVPIGTVRSRINRAREILSRTLADVGEPAA